MTRPLRRRVLYLPGYDPIPPRRYRELYRREGAAQARISGYALEFGPRHDRTGFGWGVSGIFAQGRAETDIEVLIWTDVVAGSMGRSIPATYGQLLRTAWAYLGSGALFRLMRLRRGPVIAALYPIAVLLAQALAAAALAALILWAGAVWLHWTLGLCAGLAAGGALLWWFRRIDGRIFAYYLMHDYAFTAQRGGAYPPALEARIADFAGRIAEVLKGDWDEVLIVGHSSGAYLAVSVLADVIRAETAARAVPDGIEGPRQDARTAEPERHELTAAVATADAAAAHAQDGSARAPGSAPRLSLLTLGHVVPMASFLPDAGRLRQDLAFLSARPELSWVDVTAPGDACCFGLCDPVAVSSVEPPGRRGPLVLSAAFNQTLSETQKKALRGRWFRLHFQYLCAFERPGDYDYFAITAGPLRLGQRFAGRSHSPARIARAVNNWPGRDRGAP